jgi:hypothetical protein
VIAIILRGYKFYHFRTPRWFITGEVTEPDITLPFVWLETPVGEVTYIYGYYIYASEENEFRLWWYFGGEERSIMILLPDPGTVMYADTMPINLDSPHTEGSLGLDILNQPSSGSIYQAGILASGCGWVQL